MSILTSFYCYSLSIKNSDFMFRRCITRHQCIREVREKSVCIHYWEIIFKKPCACWPQVSICLESNSCLLTGWQRNSHLSVQVVVLGQGVIAWSDFLMHTFNQFWFGFTLYIQRQPLASNSRDFLRLERAGILFTSVPFLTLLFSKKNIFVIYNFKEAVYIYYKKWSNA